MKSQILVLEDDPDLRAMLSEVLSDEGYEVTTLAAGEEAIRLAAQQNFDLLVTDVRMPGVDGLEALRQLRTQQPNLGSLVVSGYTTEAETLRALQLNVGAYLKKPFSLGDLLQRVRQILEERAERLRQTQQTQSLQRSLNWCLDSAARTLHSNAYESGQLAFYLAQRLHLPLPAAQSLRQAAMVSWAELGELHHLPAASRNDGLGLGPCWEMLNAPEHSLEKQILRAVHWLCAHEESPDPVSCPADLPEELQVILRKEDLRGSTEVLAARALERYESGQRNQLLPLLALAQTLEDQGHLESARGAYEHLLQQSELEEPTRLQILLGLARTHWKLQRPDWYEHLKQAELLSRALSSSLGGELRWAIAKLLRASQHPSAPAYLAQLEGSLQRPVDRAKVRLAAGVDVQAAQLLLQPAQRSLLHAEQDWILDALWACAPQMEPSALWCRLAGEFPQKAPHSEVLLQSLEAFPHLAPPALVEALAQRPSAGPREAQLKGRTQGSSGPLYLHFRSFGTFEVSVNGQRVGEKLFKTHKFRYVLAYLLSRRGQPVSEDVLVEEFWPNSKDAGKSSIYAATTAIRRALREGAGEADIIRREGDLLRFDPDLPIWHDLDEFESGLGRLGQNLEEDRQTLQLYTGPYLQGCYLDWALRLRSQLEEKALRCIQSLVTRTLESDPHQAVELAGQGLELDPLSQELHGLRMRAYLSLNQPENGIRQFQQCSNILRKELGIEPLTSLIELYQRCRIALP
ncbi:hypothetical protein ABS71_14245 [bacterium SCN 62-11]|nr:response regulator [Candidatus Eremiobacteraeota bacterium]ODT63495.1 MAG: hypothetical protein ABS71_14245 [bacterium SCN 62-11]